MVDLAEEEAESQVLEVPSPEVPYQKPHHQQNHLVEVLPDAVVVEEEAEPFVVVVAQPGEGEVVEVKALKVELEAQE